MDVAIVTGSAGLIGSEAARFFADQGLRVIGIDNDMRSTFFGDDASHGVEPAAAAVRRARLSARRCGHPRRRCDGGGVPPLRRLDRDGDPRRGAAVARLGGERPDHRLHGERQRHAGAAGDDAAPLPRARRSSSCSTNKVYGDTPNRLPLVELETRWECDASHRYAEHGIDESMSIDASMHSLFGVSKARPI